MGETGRDQYGHRSSAPHAGDSGRVGGSQAVGAETYLITDAPDSLEAQHRARVRKYLFLMAFRVPALLIAGIAYSLTGSGLLALAIVAVSIPLPWMAVLIANDRPPRKRGEVPQYKYGADHHVVGPPAVTHTEHQLSRTVDGHVVDPDDPRR
ncbi:DUF3099 domain-containing protein [Gordonia terrae]|uniref:DUF3099 domain-containing protein n=1 Tax=Gordonia terrae TaxID=2055 RepID=UPI003F6AF62A